MKPRVAVVVLNYNGAADTIACLRSLKRSDYAPLDLVVVDNGSNRECQLTLQSELPDTEIVFTGCNLGFAAGNNRGFRHLLKRHPKYVLFLNNDTLVEPDFLEPLVEALERDERAAAAGGVICYSPRTDIVWFGGGVFRPLRAASFAMYQDQPLARLPPGGTREVSFLTGCMMMVRVDVFQRAGMFDERFFMYFEDAELSQRLRACGHTLLFVPASKIYHKIQHRPLSPFVTYYWSRNRLLFIQAAIGGWRRPIACTYLWTIMFLKLSYWSVAKPGLFRAAAIGLVDFYAGRLHEGRGTNLPGSRTLKPPEL